MMRSDFGDCVKFALCKGGQGEKQGAVHWAPQMFVAFRLSTIVSVHIPPARAIAWLCAFGEYLRMQESFG